jgi:glucose/arabinose dehydrogenase
MFRRILVMLLLAVFCLALSACGGGAATPTREPTAAPTEQQAVPTETEVSANETVEESLPSTEEATEEAVEGAATEVSETSSENATAESLPGGTTALITFTNVARTGPGTSYGEVSPVSVGAELPVIAKSEGGNVWYLVTLESGESAWVWGRVLRLVPADAEVEIAATIPAP